MNRAELKAAIWEASQAHKEHRDCTVKALAVATGKPYAEVHAALAKAGRKPRRGTSLANMATAAKALGFTWERRDRSHFSARTVRTAERDGRLAAMGRLVLSMSGHVAGMIDGKVLDWTEGRLHRIRSAYIVRPLTPAQIHDEREPKAMAPMTRFDQQTLF